MFTLPSWLLLHVYNKGTLRAQSQMHKDAFGRKSCHTFVWEANVGTKCGHTAGTMLNIHFLVTVDTSTMRAHCGHTTVSQNKINSPEVTFTTRIMKYQHFHPPGTSFCSTYNEILTFSLSRGHFYYTYNEISTFSPSRNVFLLYV